MRRRAEVGVIAAFGAVWVIWGSTYLAIAWAVETIPPLVMIGARCVAAGAVLYGWGRVSGGPRPRVGDWRVAARSGLLLFVSGQALLAWAETRMPSGVASLLLATEPLFIALLSWHAVAGRRRAPSARAAIAIVAGFLGVAELLLPRNGQLSLDPLATSAVVLAALSWSLGMLGAAARPGFGAAQTAGMQLLAAGGMLTVLSFGVGDLSSLPSPSVRSLTAFAYLVVFGSIVAFGAYVWLLGRVTPQLVATHAYVNPLVAVAMGAALNHEPLTWSVVAAGGLILGSVVVILRATPRPEVTSAVAATSSTP